MKKIKSLLTALAVVATVGSALAVKASFFGQGRICRNATWAIGANFRSNRSNLMTTTTYYIRAFAINNAGTAYGNEVSFITSKGLTTITTAAIRNIAPRSAKSGGKIINDGGETITARGVCWSSSAHPTTFNFTTSDSSGVGVFASTLTPLTSQSTYYVRAYAINNCGTTHGNEVSFTASPANTVTDIDGNVYPYVMIGNQTWMASNLRTSHFNNGDPITNGLSGFDWRKNLPVGGGTIPAYTFPNGDSSTNIAYGKLYNTNALIDNRNVCPIGWHVSTFNDWDTLLVSLGMSQSDIDNGNPGNIGTKLLEGGSSGLNLQKAGELDVQNIYGINSTRYNNFQLWGLYLTPTFRFGSYYYLIFNGPVGPDGTYIALTNNNAGAVRCVKDR